MQPSLQARIATLRASTTVLRLAQVGLIILFLALGLTTSLTSSEGPDEAAHYYFNRFVAKYGRLPVNGEERLEAGYKADLPPLYYLIAGTVGRAIDLESPPFIKISRDDPRLKLVIGPENVKAWRMIKTEDPLGGEVLLWYVGRWVTLACGLAGLVIAYALFRATQPGFPWLALSAVALMAFLPTYSYVSGVTGYEPLTGALMALYFLLLFYTTRYSENNWLYLGLGLVIGLTAAARQTVWVLVPALPLYVLWLAYRHRWAWRSTTWRLVLVGLGVMVTFGIWVLYLMLNFNEVAELGWFQGLISPILIGDGSGRTSLQIAGMLTQGDIGVGEVARQGDLIWQWAWHFFTGVWGRGWLGWLLLAVWIVALVGLARQWRRIGDATRLWMALLVANVGLLLFFPLLRFLFSGEASTAMSQHLLFPAGAAMMVLLITGLRHWLTPIQLTGFFVGLAAIYLWLGIQAIPGRYAVTLPIQTVPVSAGEQVQARFNGISLIDYGHQADDQFLEVTLTWRTDETVSEDYRVELSLVDEKGVARSRWVGQPLNGRYPTRAWLPADRVRDVIYLPIGGLTAGDYLLQLRLLGDLNVVISDEGETLTLDSVAITPGPLVVDNYLMLGDQEIGYSLWQQDQPVEEPPLYYENATVVFAMSKALDGDIQLKLIGPDGRLREPVDHTGHIYDFTISPDFASGDYRLRVERWTGETLVAQTESPVLLRVKTEARQFEPVPMSRPVAANFAGYVALSGYDLPQKRFQPGDILPITLYWQALRTIGADLIMFSHLIDEKSQNIWGGRDRIAREVYSTMFWAPGEIVADPFTLQIAADAPDGVYYVLVGLYLPVGEASVSLPLMQDGQFSEVTSVRIGPIMIGQTPPDYTVDEAKPQVSLNRPLGDEPNLMLLGYDLTEQTESPTPGIKLTLYWRVEAPLDIDYTTFLHLRNAAGETMAQQDQMPLRGAYPTSLWAPGEIITDEIILDLTGQLPAGGYKIMVGMYDLQSGDRLTVPGNAANEVELLAVE